MAGLIARKIGMTQVFKDGNQVPVTLLDVSPNYVVSQKEGKVLLGAKARKHVSKPIQGILNKAGIKYKVSKFKEFSWGGDLPKIGEKVAASFFEPGKKVSVTATSKGKGFAGTIKRHGFHRGPASHGSANVRKPGSIGAQQPQRVVKGKKMAGHLGAETVTVKNLEVVDVNPEKHLLAVAGSVPGPNKGYVYIKQLTSNR